MLTALRLVLVSTVAGSAGLMATTPLGIVAKQVERTGARRLVGGVFAFGRLDREREAVVGACVLLAYRCERGFGALAKLVIRADRDECSRLARKRVPAYASVDPCQAKRGSPEHAAESFVRVDPALRDVAAGVTPACAGDRDFEHDVVVRHRLEEEWQPSERVRAPGAADGERLVARPVQVEQEPPAHE